MSTTSTTNLSDKEQLDALKQRLATWKQSAKQQLEDAQRKNESLRRQLESVTAERDSLRSKEEDRSIASDALVSRAVSLQEKLSASEAKLAEEVKTISVLKKQHAEQVQSLEDQISSLRQEQEKMFESLKEKENTKDDEKQKRVSTEGSSPTNEDEDEEDQNGNADEDGKKSPFALIDNDSVNFDILSSNSTNNTHDHDNENSSSSSRNKAIKNLKSRFALLQQQIDERDCRIAVLNSLYTQAKTEATNSSSAISTIREDHARVVDQLRSSISTMTVQVASKSSALENLKRQQEEVTKRAKWFEDEVQRLRDDATERERAYEEIFKQQQSQLQNSLDSMEKKNGSGGHGRFSSSTDEVTSSSRASSGFDMVTNANNNINITTDDDEQETLLPSSSKKNSSNTISTNQKQMKQLKDSLDQANNNLSLKDQKCRHMESRIEEQQSMIRQLAKQLSDANNNNNNINSNGTTSVFISRTGNEVDDEMHETSSPSKRGGSGGTTSSSSSTSRNAMKDFLEQISFTVENSRNQLQRLFNRYRVLAPLVLGVTFLVFFMIWFSRGSGPTVNRVDMFAKRTEQLEQELNAVREAYARLNSKCSAP